MTTLFTTAPESYDYGCTKTVRTIVVGYTELREVEPDAEDYEDQRVRYLSGLYESLRPADLDAMRVVFERRSM